MICKMQNAKKVHLQGDDADLKNIGSRILSVFVSNFKGKLSKITERILSVEGVGWGGTPLTDKIR